MFADVHEYRGFAAPRATVLSQCIADYYAALLYKDGSYALWRIRNIRIISILYLYLCIYLSFTCTFMYSCHMK